MIGKPKVRIAGAGALGLSCALVLAETGCEVEVFDPAEPGRNASSVAAGMLAPAFECVLDAATTQSFDVLLAARDLWPGLAARAGVDLDRRGAIWVGPAEEVETRGRELEALGASVRRLTASELSDLAPGLAPEVKAGVLTDLDWRLDARQALGALRRAAEEAGARIHHAPAPLQGEGGLVIATGASRSLAGLAPAIAELVPIKGHILRFPGAVLDAPVVRGKGVYVAPSRDGVIVGATMEVGVDDAAIDQSKAAVLAQAAGGLFPALGGAAYVADVGVRAATADGLPLVGPAGPPEVILAVGARRNGWLLAPLVAQVVRASVLGDPVGPLGQRFAPGRFAR